MWVEGTLSKYATASVDTPRRNCDLAGTPDAEKKQNSDLGTGYCKNVHTVWKSVPTLVLGLAEVSRRAVPPRGLVRNVTSRLYYVFCLVENITEQVRRGLVQYITSRPY